MDISLPAKSPEPLDLRLLWDRLPRLEMKGKHATITISFVPFHLYPGFYHSLHPFATFGPAYRRVVRCHGGPSEVIAQVQGPSADES
jgi:hypothetical protein